MVFPNISSITLGCVLRGHKMPNRRLIASKQVFLILILSGLMACGGGGGGGSTTSPTSTTTVDVFDGAAIGCTVSMDGATATEVGASSPGKYTISGTLSVGSIINATNCTDSDTNSQLPAMAGVAQSGGVVISPITTLIVAAAIANDVASGKIADRASARSVSVSALVAAKTSIVTNLGLGSYDPTDPVTANYVADAKADTAGTGTAAAVMRIALALSTLLKGVEVAAGTTNATTAISAVSESIALSITAVDLTSTAAITTVMTAAATLETTVATAITTASDAIAPSVATISSSTGSVQIAIAATTAVSTVLNTATEETISDTTVITAQLQTTIDTAVETATPICSLDISTVGGCKI